MINPNSSIYFSQSNEFDHNNSLFDRITITLCFLCQDLIFNQNNCIMRKSSIQSANASLNIVQTVFENSFIDSGGGNLNYFLLTLSRSAIKVKNQSSTIQKSIFFDSFILMTACYNLQIINSTFTNCELDSLFIQDSSNIFI
jgi:hypothetical protein